MARVRGGCWGWGGVDLVLVALDDDDDDDPVAFPSSLPRPVSFPWPINPSSSMVGSLSNRIRNLARDSHKNPRARDRSAVGIGGKRFLATPLTKLYMNSTVGIGMVLEITSMSS